METISSPTNPKIKNLVKLRKRRERDKTDLFLIEGYRELSRALSGKVEIESFFYCPELFLGENEASLIEELNKRNVSLFRCTKAVFEKASYREGPDGILAVAKKMHQSLEEFEEMFVQGKKTPFFVIAESIEKPGNLGTILRSSDGVGADGVIVCDPRTDIYNPNVVRASVGTLFTQPVIEVHADALFSWLEKKNVTIVSSSPDAKKVYTEVDLASERPLAVVVGTEQYGLTDQWLDQADLLVKIPMKGIADSLNVATATTLLLYEVLRQRSV